MTRPRSAARVANQDAAPALPSPRAAAARRSGRTESSPRTDVPASSAGARGAETTLTPARDSPRGAHPVRGRRTSTANRVSFAAAGEPGADKDARPKRESPPAAVVPRVRGRRSGAATRSTHAAAGEAGALQRPTPESASPPLADVIAEIREQHRFRQDYHSAEKRLANQIKAIVRRMSGGQPQAADGEDGTEAEESSELVPSTPGPSSPAVSLVTLHLDEARQHIAGHKRRHERRLAELAQLLPVWPFVDGIRGAGALGLAQIVGECGDLGSYRSVAGLWKRMGLAVLTWCDACRRAIPADARAAGRCPWCGADDIRHERQRRIRGDAALVHGYAPTRRSVMWNIGESLLKQNRDGVYRTLYLRRKEIEALKPPCGHISDGRACKNDEGTACAPGHVHNRARRYVEKRFLKDLRAAWRRAVPRAEEDAAT